MAATRRGRPQKIDWTGIKLKPKKSRKLKLNALAIEQGLAAIERMRNMQIAPKDAADE